MVQDLEWWLLKTTQVVKEVINDKTCALTKLKDADDAQLGLPSIELEQFNDCAFYYQDFGIDSIEYGCFVLFRWGTSIDVTSGGESSETVSLVTTIYIPDDFGTDSELQARKVLRYRRALKSSLTEAYRKYSHHDFKMISLPDGLFEYGGVSYWGIPIVSEWVFAG